MFIYTKHFPGTLLWIEVPDGGYDSRELDGNIAWRLWLEQHLWSFTQKGLDVFSGVME